MTRQMLALGLERPRNLTAELVERLAREIRAGRLRPGERLPTEQEIMGAAGVSRTVVREAIAALRAEGLVLTRQGVGAFVAEEAGRRPFRIDPASAKSLDQVLKVMELRMSLEIEAAGLAAERRSSGQLKRIGEALAGIDEHIERGETAVDADFEFHAAIAEATDNSYFAEFLRFLGRVIIPRQTVQIGYREPVDRTLYLRRVQGEHRAIFDAVKARDAAAARGAMRRHLEGSRDRYRRLREEIEGGDDRARGRRPRGRRTRSAEA